MKLFTGLAALLLPLSMQPAALAAPQQTSEAASFATVSSEAFSKKPGDAVLIDIREPSEWAQTGVPASAKLISVSRTDFVDSILASVGGDKSRPVALICRSGNRSAKGAALLTAAGFTNVANIGDGMSGREGVGPGWVAAKLPVVSYSSGE